MLCSNSLLCIYLKSFKAPFLPFSCILYLGPPTMFLFPYISTPFSSLVLWSLQIKEKLMPARTKFGEQKIALCYKAREDCHYHKSTF